MSQTELEPEQEQQTGLEVEVLFFRIGADQLGADASQVLRIAGPGVPGARRSLMGSSAPKRALVFQAGEDATLGALEVDVVLGVRSIPTRDLRRVPLAARVAPHAIGFWLNGDHPVLLVDLPRMLPPSSAGDDQPFTPSTT